MRITLLSLLCCFGLSLMAANIDNTIKPGGEYLIYNVYYNKVLGPNGDSSSPALSDSATWAHDKYVFVAEASTLDAGYYWLRNKATGKYLQASNKEGDTWSVWFAGSLNKEYNSYEWGLVGGVKGEITSMRGSKINSAGNYWLAPDPNHEGEEYVYVYYDKPRSDRSVWQIVSAGASLAEARTALYASELEAAISRGEAVMDNPVYGTDSDKEALAAALYNARTALNQLTYATLDRAATATDALLAAIQNTMSGKYAMWITGKSFNTGAAFTVALKGLTLQGGATGSMDMLVRNSSATGAILTISANGVKAGDTTFAFPEDITTTKQDLLLSFDGSNLSIYAGSALLGTVPQGAVPTMTAVGQAAEWTVFGHSLLATYRPEILSFNRALSPGQTESNSHGKPEVYAIRLVGQDLTMSEAVDYHILSDSAMVDSKVNLTNPDSWLFFDAVRPSTVDAKYRESLSINGDSVYHHVNGSIAIYLQGTAIIPHDAETYKPFYGYTDSGFGGEEFVLYPGCNNDLGEYANNLHSFILKRGYMATLAINSNGGGYSRVYVADHEDKYISTLPDLLDSRVSFIYVRPWQYVSKKGWCSTDSDEGIQHQGNLLGASWFYSWSADRESNLDMEFVPMKCHLYWPGWEQFDKLYSTAALSLNEPEHNEQHTSNRCGCGGTIDSWKSCTLNPEFFYTGMRIGGPSPTEASYLNEYIGHCNDMAYRCDFVGYHAYWGTNEAANASAWRNRLKSIYDNTKRPIWLTEWNNGASWTKETWPSDWNDKLDYQRRKIKEVVEMLEEADFIERYAAFNLSEDQRKLLKWDSDKDDWWVTPAGEAYRDATTHHAYNESMQYIPHGWFPSPKDEVTFTTDVNEDDLTLSVTITNPNGDFSRTEVLEYADANGDYHPLFTTPRHMLDSVAARTVTLDMRTFPEDVISRERVRCRIKVTTLKDHVLTSAVRGLVIPEALRTGIEAVKAPAAYTVDGRTVSANEAVAVHTAGGVKVADLAPGASVTLAPGLYLIGADKVMIK